MSDFYAQLERQLVEAGRRRSGRARRRLAPAGRGRPLLAVATALIAVVAGVAFAPALRLGDFAGGGGGGGGAPPAPPAVTSPPAAPAGMSLRGIRVAVLNATTISGLARDAADVLEDHDATIDTIGSAAQQDLTRSVVDFRAGAQKQARLVARVLGVPNTARCLPPSTRPPQPPRSSSGSGPTAAGADRPPRRCARSPPRVAGKRPAPLQNDGRGSIQPGKESSCRRHPSRVALFAPRSSPSLHPPPSPELLLPTPTESTR